MTRARFLMLASFAVIAGSVGPADAQALRPFCSNRPSLGSSGCIVDVGHAMLELGIGDWERTQDADGRTDTVQGGQATVRYGILPSTEVQLGWTAIGRVRMRDAATGAVQRMTGTGDVTLAVRQNLRNPDGSGFSAAVQPFATVPVGGSAIGAGSWGAGVLVPVGYELSDRVQVQFTGEVDAAPDQDRSGRHLAMSGIVGIGVDLTDAVSTTTELFVERDRDPGDRRTTVLAAFSGGYQLSDTVQIDSGAAIGLNAASPDVRLFFGLSRRF